MGLLVHTIAGLTEGQVEVLGLTWGALILYIGGALGGFTRALLSTTQKTLSRRTFADMLIGGASGVILPVVGPKLVPFLDIDVTKLLVIHQSVIAFFLGGTGSWIFTVVGWRIGYIRPSEDKIEFVEQPRPGVLDFRRDKKEDDL